MVPDTTLGDLVAIKHGFAFSSEYFRDEPTDRVLLTPGNFHVDKRLYFGPRTKFYDGPVPQGYSLSNGDLLVVMTDLTKDMAILGNAVVLEAEKEVLHNQRIGLVDIKAPDRIDRDYLCSLLNSDIVQRHVRATASGTTVRHTSPKRILEVRAPVPPLPEQRKIAEILSTWDRAIETTEALLTTARTQKRALMQSLLTGKRRFPEFEGQEWKEVRLGDVMHGKKVKGKIVPTNDEGIGVPYIGATSFEGEFSTHTDAHGAALCDPSDLLVLWDGENAGAVAVGLRGAVSSTVVRFRFKTEMVLASFVCAVMDMRNYKIRAVREGSGIPHMPKDFDRWFEFSLPTFAEQEKIMSVLDQAQAEIKSLHRQTSELRTEKKALMQQLLTGKRRVVVDA